MRRNDASGRASAGNDDHRRDAPHRPSHFRSDGPRVPRLDVEQTEQRLQVPQNRLDFDDEQRAAGRVECQQVDPAALAVPAEADLRADDPAPSLQAPLPVLLQKSVAGVDQQPRIRRSSQNVNHQPGAHRLEKVSDDVDLQATYASRLEIHERRTRSPCPRADISLAPSTPMPQTPRGPADLFVPHDASVADHRLPAAYRALTSALTRPWSQRSALRTVGVSSGRYAPPGPMRHARRPLLTRMRCTYGRAQRHLVPSVTQDEAGLPSRGARTALLCKGI
jgi:hypothetical protein